MKCQRCGLRDAVTFNLDTSRSKMGTLLVCAECSLPVKDGVFARLTEDARRILSRAGRELTDPGSAPRVRPALLYYLLEVETSPGVSVLARRGVDLVAARAEIAAFLSGESRERGHWVSSRGLTPVLVSALGAARRLGSETVGAGHLLLGILESPEPGDPWLLIRMSGLAGEIEKSLAVEEAAVPTLPGL